MIGTRRRGRWLSLGPLQFETRDVGGERRVFFDPIGSVDHCGCVAWTSEEWAAIEDSLYELLCERLGMAEAEIHRLFPSCRICRERRGGNFEFNLRGYQVGVEVWWPPAYRVGMWLNRVLCAREERRAAA